MVKAIVATINMEGINKKKVKYAVKNTKRGDLQDGGPVRCGDHLPPRKYIKNAFTCGTTTEHLLNAGRRPQTSKKAS